MLTKEQNERLTRVGPETPGGKLMRHYWHPVAAAAQLRDRRVMPIRLLGEDLVLFRDASGRIGLVGDRCAHRLVKLECGYTVEDGLRCPYHGWTYDTQGRCVDQPGEPEGSSFKDKVTIASYPVEEFAGLIFAYLGPKDRPRPLLPRWDRLVWDNCYRVIGLAVIPCNWLQCMENGPDPIHTEYLHGQFFKHWLEREGIPKDDPKWRLAEGFTTHFLKHDYSIGEFGLDRRWLLEGQSGNDNIWKTSLPLVFPEIHMTSGGGRHNFGWRVPIDDTRTMEIFMRVFDPGAGAGVPKQESIPYVEIDMVSKDGQWLRLDAITGQDAMVWATQGEVTDRTAERLGDTDRGIILWRQLLESQIQLVEAGKDPINVFRDPAKNVRIDLPVPWDRGYAWGYAKDGTYLRGSATAGDMLPPHVVAEVEDLYVAAAEHRARETVAAK